MLFVTLDEISAERWLSGRKRTTRNRVNPYGFRGFKSLSLRQHPFSIENKIRHKTDFRCILLIIISYLKWLKEA